MSDFNVKLSETVYHDKPFGYDAKKDKFRIVYDSTTGDVAVSKVVRDGKSKYEDPLTEFKSLPQEHLFQLYQAIAAIIFYKTMKESRRERHVACDQQCVECGMKDMEIEKLKHILAEKNKRIENLEEAVAFKKMVSIAVKNKMKMSNADLRTDTDYEDN